MDQNNEPTKIIFETEQFQRSGRSSQTSTSTIAQFVIKYSGGYVKDEKQAQYVLIGFVALAIVVAFVFLFSGGGSKARFEAPPGRKIIYPENEPPRLDERS